MIYSGVRAGLIVRNIHLEAANLARNNEKKVKGIVINAFSEPFVVPIEMFDLIADIPSSFEDKAEPDNK